MRVCVYIAVFTLHFAFAQSADVEPIGIVSKLQGTWTRIQDQRVLAPGDEVFARSAVRCDSSTTNSIRIALFDGSTWSKVCTRGEPCDGGSYRIFSANETNRSFLTFVKTYFRARAMVPLIFTASRGIGSVATNEAVLALRDDHTVNLTPALRDVPRGRWLVSLSDPSRSRETGATQQIDWPQTTSFRAAGLAPGVYALDVRSETGGPLGPPSAILLTDSAQAQKAQEEFDQARDLTLRWDDMDATTKRAFLVQVVYAIQIGLRP